MANFKQAIEMVGEGVDAAGVLVVVIGVVVASLALPRRLGRMGAIGAYKEYRQHIGRAILLGLELLVAGDIIRTVAIDPTLRSVLVLGIIVLIRTFLSVALTLELEGRWPWEPRTPAAGPPKP